MTVALSAGAVLILATIAWCAVRAVRALGYIGAVLTGIKSTIGEGDEVLQSVFGERLKLLEQDVEGLPRKWEAIKREAAAAETRARYHATRAINELEEHGLTSPGLEGVARDLQLDHAPAGNGEGVPAVHEGVEIGTTDDDWRAQTLRRKYG